MQQVRPRHWGFTRPGKLNVDLIRQTIERYGAADRGQYVELIYPFEETDECVYQDVRETMTMLQSALGEAAASAFR